jgi:sarcosine oxidase
VLLVDVTDAVHTTPALSTTLPSLICVPCPSGEGTPFDDVYTLPPIEYGDGRTYVKIGTSVYDNTLADVPATAAWFRGPSSAPDVETLWGDVLALYPVLEGLPHKTLNCALTMTPSGRPILKEVVPGIIAAVGGNGAAAKSSDEIGRLAACLALGRWDASYDLGEFDGKGADTIQKPCYKE